MERHKTQGPVTDRLVNRPHAVSAGELEDRELTLRPTAFQSVFVGRSCVGHVFTRGRLGFEAYDRDDVSLGTFSTAPQAVAAISRRLP